MSTVSRVLYQDEPPALLVHFTDAPVRTLPLSPKAIVNVVRFFEECGVGRMDELLVDDDTKELIEPDVIGKEVAA